MIALPHSTLNIITENEPVSPAVTNRPMLQLWDNIESLAIQAGSVTPSATAPINPTLGLQWTDTNGVSYAWNGSFWEPTSGVFIQATTPTKGREGLMWYKTTDPSALYIHNGFYYAEYTSGTGGTGSTSASGLIPLAISDTYYTATGGETFVPIAIATGDKVHVHINSLMLDEVSDFTTSLTGVTLIQALDVGSKVKITKFSTGSVAVNIGVVTNEVLLTSSTSVIPLTSSASDTVMFYVDGILIPKSEYTLSGTTATLSNSLAIGQKVNFMVFTPSDALAANGVGTIAEFDAIINLV